MSRDSFSEAPATPAPAPAPQTEAAPRVRVVDVRTGTTGTVPADSVDSAIATGRVRLASAEESQAAQQRIEYGNRPIVAGLAGAANTATFGLVDGESIQGLREENADAFETGGIVGSTALGFGAGAALGGVRALGMAGRVAAGIGEGVVGATADAAGAMSDDRWEGDANTNAESILATLGGSALLGGSLGGVFELGAAGLGGVGRRLLNTGRRGGVASREAIGTLIERTTGREAAPGVADAILERIGRVGTSGLEEADAAFVQRGLSRTAEGRALREVIDRGDSVIDDALVPLRRQIDDLQQVASRTAEEASGTLKRDQVRRMVSETAIGDAGEELAGFSGAVREMAEMLRNEPGAIGGQAMARRLDEYVGAAEDAILNGMEQGGRDGATDAFIALDQLKRRYGREVARAGRGNLRSLAPELEAVYETGRRFLEREDLFGAAAVAQREVNSAWSELISTSGEFRRRFLTGAGENDEFTRLLTADPRRLRNFLQSTGTAVGSLDDEIFEKYLTRQQRFNRAVGDNYDLADDLRDAYAQSDRTLGELMSTRESIKNSVAARNQFQEVSQRLAERAGIFGGDGLSIGGAVAGGPLGFAVGKLAQAVSRPDQAIRMMASVERMTQTFRGRLQSRSRGFVDAMARPTRTTTNSNRNAARGAVVAMSAAEVASRFNRVVETVEKNGDMEGMADRLSEQTAQLGEGAPETATLLAAAAMRAQSYLQSQMPALAYDVPVPLGAPQSDPSERVTQDEQRALLRVAETIEDPLRVLEEASRGTLTMEHTETLRAVYPNLHTELVTTVTETIADRDEPLPYAGRLHVALLLGIPTDPSLTPEALASSQAGYATESHVPDEGQTATRGPLLTPGNREPTDTASMHQTTNQRISS